MVEISRVKLAKWRVWWSLQDFRNFLSLLTTIDETDRRRKKWPDYEFLAILANELQDPKNNLLWIPKSRRMLLTWICCAYVLWDALRSNVYLGILQSQKEDHSKKLIHDKIKVLWELLPYWYRFVVTDGLPDQVRFTVLEMTFPGNRTIMSVPQGSHQFRQHTPSVIMVDEASHHEEFEQTLASVLPFLEKKTVKLIFVSSVTGEGLFSRILKDERPLDLETLLPGHEDLPAEYRKGLTKWRLAKGGTVLQPHFSVHPDRHNDWLQIQDEKIPAGGIHSTFFRQEYNIEYDAFSGAQVFPHFNVHDHVYEFDIPKGAPLYLAADYGLRNPTAVLKIAEIGENQEGPIYGVAREFRAQGIGIEEIKRQLWMIFGPPEKYEAEIIDPSVDAMREADSPTHLDMFNNGQYARFFQKGNRSEDAKVIIHEWLHEKRLVIHPSCVDLIFEMQKYRHQDWKGKTELEHNPKEQVVKKDDHSVDALRYFANYIRWLELPTTKGAEPTETDMFFEAYNNRERWVGEGFTDPREAYT